MTKAMMTKAMMKNKRGEKMMTQLKKNLFILTVIFVCGNLAYANKGCENIKKATVKAVNKAIDKGCGYVATEFDVACISITAAETAATSTVPCSIGSAILGFNCKYYGKKYAQQNAENIGKNICDVVYPDTAPYIFIENHLEAQKIDFSVVVKAGNDIHMHGNNWLEGKSIGILASNELDGKHYTVKARVKKEGSDEHIEIHHVVPNQDKVYVYYKEGKYHIKKKPFEHKPMIAIENHLDKHKADFQVVINNSTDVHLPGNNWLEAGGKTILTSYKLFGNSYTVKVRIKRDGESDIHLEEHHVEPGKHAVYVGYKEGKYYMNKKGIDYSSK
jgi:hypothetical protein